MGKPYMRSGIKGGGLFLTACFSVLLMNTVLAQGVYDQNLFSFPLDFRPVLSGTFGELRANHFHSGIDIKTQGTGGKNIYAIDDGYISRIKVSSSGFGNTLYVNHEEGYTSVFAHLQDFREDISEFVREEQYRRESFDVDIYPEQGQFLVRKGEVIAHSGNSGYSLGPHLHFEIREASTQKPINPLLFGFDIEDDLPPKIKKLKIYPENKESMVNHDPVELTLGVSGYGENHQLEETGVINVYGDLSFGLMTYDLLNGAANRNGIYEMKVWFDDTLIFHLRLEKFAFSETRYINSLIDYAEYVRSKDRLIRTKLDPNNQLNIYEHIVNDGIVSVRDSNHHQIVFEVSDVTNNRSRLRVRLKGTGLPLHGATDDEIIAPGTFISWRDESLFEVKGLRLEFPAYAFYDNINFTYRFSEAIPGTYSPLHFIHYEETPVHKYFTISIQPVDLPVDLQVKALIAKVNGDNGQAMTPVGGGYREGMITGSIREFGKYTVVVDTIAPIIKPLNVSVKRVVQRNEKLNFLIKDEFSGIRSYRGTINGQWILMQYDAKNDLLYHIIDDRTQKGINHLKLEVRDQKDNASVFEAELILN